MILKHKLAIAFVPVAVGAIFLGGCAAPSKTGYVPGYLQADALYRDSRFADFANMDDSQVKRLLGNFSKLFSDLKQDGLENTIRETYAETIYFNDTLHTFTDRESLADYLLDTAEKVDVTTVTFDEIGQSGDSFFVRWTMVMEFEVNGKPIRSESIGVSQVRFDSKGKVVFHQDFWDNNEGLLRHLPVVGNVIHSAMKRI